MVDIINIVTVIISIYLCIKHCRNIVINSRYIIYFVFFVFYVFPIIIDVLFIKADYTYNSNYIGFALAQSDVWTNIIYDISIIFAQIVLLNYKKSRDSHVLVTDNRIDDGIQMEQIKWLFVLGMILPTFVVLFFPVDKMILYTFQWRENDLLELTRYAALAESLSYIAIFCSVVLFFRKKPSPRWYQRVVIAIFMYMNICIQGKRSILFFFLLAVVISLIPGLADKSVGIKERRKKIIGLIILAVVVLAIMVYFSIFVKVNSRGGVITDLNKLFTSNRIDFLRDDRVKVAIYSMLHKAEMPMLDYPMQTIVTFPLAFFPLDFISQWLGIKYYTYAAYISAAVELRTVTNAWVFMTPSIYAELVSNLGFIGLLLMPFIGLWFARLADRLPYPRNVLVIMTFIALQMYAFKYMGYLIEFNLIVYLATNVRFTSNRYRR